MSKSRSVLVFEQYCQSPITRKHYIYELERFVRHFKLDSIDEILTMPELKEKIEDYVISFKTAGKSVGTIRVITFALQSFLEANDVTINFKKIRKLLGKKSRPKKSRYFTSEEIKALYTSCHSDRARAIVTFLSASGVRRGALSELKISDLKEIGKNCLAVTVYENTDSEYTTFINGEAKKDLMKYFDKRKSDGEKLESTHPVFRANYKHGFDEPIFISEKVVSNLVWRLKESSGIDWENTPNLLAHAFRRRFNTIFKLQSNPPCNISIVERLLGHDLVSLDSAYFQPSTDELFKEYQKAIPDLTIDDKTRVLEEVKVLKVEKSELIKANKEIKALQDERMEAKFKKMWTEELLAQLDGTRKKQMESLK